MVSALISFMLWPPGLGSRGYKCCILGVLQTLHVTDEDGWEWLFSLRQLMLASQKHAFKVSIPVHIQQAETPRGVPVSPATWRRLKSVLSCSENVFGCPWREAGGGWGRCGSHEQEAEWWCLDFRDCRYLYSSLICDGGAGEVGATEAKRWRSGGVQMVCGRGFKLKMQCVYIACLTFKQTKSFRFKMILQIPFQHFFLFNCKIVLSGDLNIILQFFCQNQKASVVFGTYFLQSCKS